MGILGNSLDLIMVYKFLRGLTMPFIDTDAYDLGIIDSQGNILKKHSDLKTEKEKNAYTIFNRVIWKMKRILEKVPFGKAKLASYVTALWFLKEGEREAAERACRRYLSMRKNQNYLSEDVEETGFLSGKCKLLNSVCNIDDEVIASVNETVYVPEQRPNKFLGHYIYTAIKKNGSIIPVSGIDLQVVEDAPANSAGGGEIAGLGVGEKGEPGLFAGCRLFKVSPDIFHRSMRGKTPQHAYKRYVDEGGVGEEIREYGRKNPKKGIVLQNSTSGEMIYLKRGRDN